jgi:peptidoglycan/LPS O-acetylase OafA/YrhL
MSKFLAGLPLLETLGLPKSVNASLWSVAYEFRMYLLVPILGYLGILNHSWRVASLALLVSLYWCFGSVPSRLPGPGINFLVINPSIFLRGTTMFLWGSWFYSNYEKIPRKQMVFIGSIDTAVGIILSSRAQDIFRPTRRISIHFNGFDELKQI